jgi:putative resolvase
MINYRLDMNDQLLTVTEACKLLQIAPSTLRRADANGTIRVIRTPGGRRRVPMSEVQRYLSQRTPDQQEAA